MLLVLLPVLRPPSGATYYLVAGVFPKFRLRIEGLKARCRFDSSQPFVPVLKQNSPIPISCLIS